MLDTRLALALDQGGLVLPASGVIAAIKPQVDDKRAFLNGFDFRVFETFAPQVREWRAAGVEPVQEITGGYAAVIVSLPRAKAEAYALIAQAMQATAGPVVIDGQKTDGVDSILRDMRRRVEVMGPVNKSHGKLFWCPDPNPAAFEDWRAGPTLTEGGFWTAPGVFSANEVDAGSALLASYLPEELGRQVADLGAGWGYLAAHVLTRDKVAAVHLVEAEFVALECARRNVTDSRAQFHWSDVQDWLPPVAMDTVVMNPPFHVGRAADSSLGAGFIHKAASVLTRGGGLWMVANRHLPYERSLAAHFAEVREIGGDTRFKLFHAKRPLRSATRSA